MQERERVQMEGEAVYHCYEALGIVVVVVGGGGNAAFIHIEHSDKVLLIIIHGDNWLQLTSQSFLVAFTLEHPMARRLVCKCNSAECPPPSRL